jgi:hypothetical protein
LSCAITLEINQSWIPSFLEWSPHAEISACLCGRLLQFVWDVALLCLRPHTSVDITVESKKQHDTGRVTLGLLFMGRNKAITASRLVVFCRTRFITRTTLARDENSYAYLCVFSLSLHVMPATPQEHPERPCVVASKGLGTLVSRPIRHIFKAKQRM